MEGAESYRSYLQSSFWYSEIDRSSLCVLQASEFLHEEGGGQMQQTFLPTGRQSSKPITTTDCSHAAYYTTLSTDYVHVLQQYLDSSQLPRITEYLTIPELSVNVCCIDDSSQQPVPQIVPKPLLHCFTFSRHFYNFNLGFKGKIFSFACIILSQGILCI
jgi:hypothetical protein